MKILYAIQGTGNGHLSRAREIVPILQKKGELDLLVSGIQADVELPYPLTYRFKGLSFIFGKRGGVDLLKTYIKSRSVRLLREIRRVPVQNYDLVINDFEPVSAWACYRMHKKCIALSHQSAVIDPLSPQPDHNDLLGKFILKKYAPHTDRYGFHFQAYAENIYTPVIRRQIRELEPFAGGHYTVYLPSFSEKKLLKVLSNIDVKWEVFSKHSKRVFQKKNVHIYPINNKAFVKSVASSIGVLCGAGFETPAEVLYLKKKLLVIPMKSQYEQHCNAAALRKMGVPILKKFKMKNISEIEEWIQHGKITEVAYPDTTESIIDRLIDEHTYAPDPIKKSFLSASSLPAVNA